MFFTYLYATTYFGLPLVANKALLAPLAHDEWPIYASMWNEFFDRPAGFLFNSPEEREFLQGRFPTAALSGPIAGIGIEAPVDVRPERFRRRFGIDGPFIVYVGRIDASKGVHRLLDLFAFPYKRIHDDAISNWL